MTELEELYKEIILDHYRKPRNRGTLETPPAKFAEGRNPLCGDEIDVYVEVEDGIVRDIKIDGHGCSISQSSASLMTNAVKGKSLREVLEINAAFKSMMGLHKQEIAGAGIDPEAIQKGIPQDSETTDESDPQFLVNDKNASLGDIEALRGVVKFPVRVKCATLCWNTLAQAINQP